MKLLLHLVWKLGSGPHGPHAESSCCVSSDKVSAAVAAPAIVLGLATRYQVIVIKYQLSSCISSLKLLLSVTGADARLLL